MFLELKMLFTDSDSGKFLFLQFLTEEQANGKISNESRCLHIKKEKEPKKEKKGEEDRKWRIFIIRIHS